MLEKIIAVIVGYLLGSIPWALIIGKVFYKKDIREFGSHNLGASNSWMELSKGAGVAVAILDTMKVFVAMAIANYYNPELIAYAGVAACMGHCYPCFAQFRGGKATASAFGYFLGLTVFVNHNWFWQFFFPLISIFTVLYISRMITFASMVTMSLEIVVNTLIIHNPLPESIGLVLLWVLIIFRHSENIKRIFDGTEYKIERPSFRKKKTENDLKK